MPANWRTDAMTSWLTGWLQKARTRREDQRDQTSRVYARRKRLFIRGVRYGMVRMCICKYVSMYNLREKTKWMMTEGKKGELGIYGMNWKRFKLKEDICKYINFLRVSGRAKKETGKIWEIRDRKRETDIARWREEGETIFGTQTTEQVNEWKVQ